MNFTRLLLLVAGITGGSQAFSQKLSHSIGLDLVLPGKGIETQYLFTSMGMWMNNATTKLTRVSVAYFPRYTLIAEKNKSVSIGMPIAVGIGLPNTTMYMYSPASSMFPPPLTTKENIKSNARFAAEIPLVADFNWGAGATPKSTGKVGGFIGAGYAYNHSSYQLEDGLYMYTSDVFLAYFHGGVRLRQKKTLTIGITCRPKKTNDREERHTSCGIQVFREL